VVSSTPRPHFTPGKDPVPILREAWWTPGPVWTGGKSRPHRDSIAECPARSQSLYRLSYPCGLVSATKFSSCFHTLKQTNVHIAIFNEATEHNNLHSYYTVFQSKEYSARTSNAALYLENFCQTLKINKLLITKFATNTIQLREPPPPHAQ
jgi:hypothetical protein